MLTKRYSGDKMKIYVLAPKENWICDRIASEWRAYFPEHTVNTPEDADIIWLQAGWCWNHIEANLLLVKKVVCTEHHIVPSKFTQKSRDEFRYRDQFVDAYHVPNIHTKDIVSQLTQKPITIINYWYDPKKWYPGDREKSKARLGLPSSAYIVGSFQRDSEGETENPKLEKGPDLFCDYVEKLSLDKNVHVLLGGWRRKYVIKRLEESGIPYTMKTMVSLDVLREMYLACNLYVVSSRQEGGPQALLEAPSTRTPIITTDMGIARQVINSNCIVDISSDVYYPSEEDVELNYNNVLKYNIEEYGNVYMNYFKEVLENV
jgi:glycosyltransferase involved in cell wall biosynthesis